MSSFKDQAQLLAKMKTAFHPDGPQSKTTADSLGAFLAILIDEMLGHASAAAEIPAFTEQRVLATKLAGYLKSPQNRPLTVDDSVETALEVLEKRVDDASTIPPTVKAERVIYATRERKFYYTTGTVADPGSDGLRMALLEAQPGDMVVQVINASVAGVQGSSIASANGEQVRIQPGVNYTTAGFDIDTLGACDGISLMGGTGVIHGNNATILNSYYGSWGIGHYATSAQYRVYDVHIRTTVGPRMNEATPNAVFAANIQLYHRGDIYCETALAINLACSNNADTNLYEHEGRLTLANSCQAVVAANKARFIQRGDITLSGTATLGKVTNHSTAELYGGVVDFRGTSAGQPGFLLDATSTLILTDVTVLGGSAAYPVDSQVAGATVYLRGETVLPNNISWPAGLTLIDERPHVSASDIVNTLTQVTPGKVLDAAQGKILSDALTTLQQNTTTTLGGKVDTAALTALLASKADLVGGVLSRAQQPTTDLTGVTLLRVLNPGTSQEALVDDPAAFLTMLKNVLRQLPGYTNGDVTQVLRGDLTWGPVSASPPTITSFSPSSAAVGATVTVTGTNLTGATAVTLNGGAVSTFTVNSATSLTLTIPSGGSTGAVAITTPAGTATSAGSLTVTPAAPTISSFSPTSGGSGVSVTVTGTNFTGATAVTLNGTSVGSFTVASSTSITFTTAASSTTGPIAVTTPGGTATSASSFTYQASSGVPTITNVSPSSGLAGASVTLTGTNFTGVSGVTLGSTTVSSYTVNSSSQITATVPGGASSGTFNVTNAAGTGSSAAFTVTPPAPAIASFTPTSGPTGTSVTITGTDLTGATAVSVNGTAVTSFSVSNATTISCVVAAGTTSGTLSVTTPGGTATSSASFAVSVAAPTITNLSPTTVAVGGTVTVTGTNLTAASAVKVGSLAATYSVASATSLTLTVPTGATTGSTVSVTTGGGTATSSGTLTISSALTDLATDPSTVAPTGSTTRTGNSLAIAGSNTNSNAVFAGLRLPAATAGLVQCAVTAGTASGTLALGTGTGTPTGSNIAFGIVLTTGGVRTIINGSTNYDNVAASTCTNMRLRQDTDGTSWKLYFEYSTDNGASWTTLTARTTTIGTPVDYYLKTLLISGSSGSAINGIKTKGFAA